MELSLNDVQSLIGIYVIVEAIDKNHHSGSLVVTYKINGTELNINELPEVGDILFESSDCLSYGMSICRVDGTELLGKKSHRNTALEGVTKLDRYGYYIGVTTVKASWIESFGSSKGYKVCYPNGRVEQLSKEEFESTYMRIANPNSVSEQDVTHMLGDGGTIWDVDDKTTLVRITTPTGVKMYDTSSCVDPANYDKQIGAKICVDRIKNKLWGHLGFVLQWAKNGLKN